MAQAESSTEGKEPFDPRQFYRDQSEPLGSAEGVDELCDQLCAGASDKTPARRNEALDGLVMLDAAQDDCRVEPVASRHRLEFMRLVLVVAYATLRNLQ